MAYKWHIVALNCLAAQRKRRMISMRILIHKNKANVVRLFFVWIFNTYFVDESLQPKPSSLTWIVLWKWACRSQEQQITTVFFLLFLFSSEYLWYDYVKWQHITIEMHGIQRESDIDVSSKTTRFINIKVSFTTRQSHISSRQIYNEHTFIVLFMA